MSPAPEVTCTVLRNVSDGLVVSIPALGIIIFYGIFLGVSSIILRQVLLMPNRRQRPYPNKRFITLVADHFVDCILFGVAEFFPTKYYWTPSSNHRYRYACAAHRSRSHFGSHNFALLWHLTLKNFWDYFTRDLKVICPSKKRTVFI